mmetsp:Transcript_82318/g.251568  ORF Transcript_82318/g.251568 Transcript_82318/m.251568 type:complete len:356 (-) Transcript_82318:319-1386(-)
MPGPSTCHAGETHSRGHRCGICRRCGGGLPDVVPAREVWFRVHDSQSPEQAALHHDGSDVGEDNAERVRHRRGSESQLDVRRINAVRNQDKRLDVDEATQEADHQGWHDEPPTAERHRRGSAKKGQHHDLHNRSSPKSWHAEDHQAPEGTGNEHAHLVCEVRPLVPTVPRVCVRDREAHARPHPRLNDVLRGVHQEQRDHEGPQGQREAEALPESQRGRHRQVAAGLRLKVRGRPGRGLGLRLRRGAHRRHGAHLRIGTAEAPTVDPGRLEHGVEHDQPRDRDPQPDHQLDLEARVDGLGEQDRPEVTQNASEARAAGPSRQALFGVVERRHCQHAGLANAGLECHQRHAEQLDR